MAPLKPEELHQLVSNAVEQALRQRKLTDADLRELLHGPITIGLLADPQVFAQEPQKTFAVAAKPGIYDKHRLIGFVAPNIEKLESELKSK